jgi:predicted enzyme related to lactoylglutathione lyase
MSPSRIAFVIALSIVGCAAPQNRCPTTTTAPSPTAAQKPSSPRVTGIGGIFFKAKDSKALTAWYVEHLGFPPPRYGVQFEWRENDAPSQHASTTWGTFPETTKYFDPTTARFMINYRVVDLDGMLARLRQAGARVDEKVVEEENGRFGWATDPEGNRFELWEPKPGH